MNDDLLDRTTKHIAAGGAISPAAAQAFVDVARAAQRLADAGWRAPALREALKRLEDAITIQEGTTP